METRLQRSSTVLPGSINNFTSSKGNTCLTVPYCIALAVYVVYVMLYSNGYICQSVLEFNHKQRDRHIAIFLLTSQLKPGYEALRRFKILQLPSVTTLKMFKGPRLHQPAIKRDIQEYIQEQQVNYYTKYKSEVQERG